MEQSVTKVHLATVVLAIQALPSVHSPNPYWCRSAGFQDLEFAASRSQRSIRFQGLSFICCSLSISNLYSAKYWQSPSSTLLAARCWLRTATSRTMEPEVAALSLLVSPYHLAIPRSFHMPVVESITNNRVRGVSPYGRSPHCLLSTDSLVPLLPVTNGAAHLICDISYSKHSLNSMAPGASGDESMPPEGSNMNHGRQPSETPNCAAPVIRRLTSPPSFNTDWNQLPWQSREDESQAYVPPTSDRISPTTESNFSQVWQPTPDSRLNHVKVN